jgi:hypothetical protein
MKWSLQLDVYRRDYWTSVYCDYDARKSHDDWLRGNLCVDHFKPRKKGGTDEIGNLKTACRPCNAYKGENWFPTLEAARRWLRLYREEMSRPWFDHHVTNSGTIEGWRKKHKMTGPAWERLKQEIDRAWEFHNEEKEQVT